MPRAAAFDLACCHADTRLGIVLLGQVDQLGECIGLVGNEIDSFVRMGGEFMIKSPADPWAPRAAPDAGGALCAARRACSMADARIAVIVVTRPSSLSCVQYDKRRPAGAH